MRARRIGSGSGSEADMLIFVVAVDPLGVIAGCEQSC